MDNQVANNDTDTLARRMLNRIWNDLPAERRNSDELRSEALQLTSRVAANSTRGNRALPAVCDRGVPGPARDISRTGRFQ